MQQPKISIIIPVYNAEKTLNRCLDTLVSQTYKNIEILRVRGTIEIPFFKIQGLIC